MVCLLREIMRFVVSGPRSFPGNECDLEKGYGMDGMVCGEKAKGKERGRIPRKGRLRTVGSVSFEASL